MSSIREGSTGSITGRIVDEDGVGIPATALTAVTYTLYDYSSGSIINSRNGVNMLNANGGTVSSVSGSEGNFVIPITVLDSVIVDTTKLSEIHVALVRFTTADSAGSGELRFTVQNVKKIT